MPWYESEEEEFLTMDDEEGRKFWTDFVLEADEWCQAIMVRDDRGNMIVRFRYEDGNEELFDVSIRKMMPIVVKDEAGSN